MMTEKIQIEVHGQIIEIERRDGKFVKPDELKQLEGYNVALKPAFEPVIVAMKPLDSTFAANALAHGVAGLWIDGARVAANDFDPKDRVGATKLMEDRPWQEEQKRNGRPRIIEGNSQGRWPANVALLHSPDCVRVGTRRVRGDTCHGEYTVKGAKPSWKNSSTDIRVSGYADPDGLETVDEWQCVPDCPARMLGEQSGERPTSKGTWGRNADYAWSTHNEDQPIAQGFGDTGTAARFFYQAKASRTERNEGCEEFYWKRDGKQLVRVDRDEWETLDDRQRARGNIHPTVKPLGMLEYLCKLTRTPTGGIVFDPFIGSGTTAIAAIKTGRPFYGCDNNQDYVDIATARVGQARLELAQLEMNLEA